MNATLDEQREAARRIAELGDPRLAARMELLWGLRYRGKELDGRVEIMNRFLTREIMLESVVVQDWLRQGEEKGEARGEAEGIRRVLRRLLTQQFGELPQWAEDKLHGASVATLESWTTNILAASTIEEALR